MTDDGAETDLDLGHYERFTGVLPLRGDNVTTGQIYRDIFGRDMAIDFAAVVQVIPHVTDAIKNSQTDVDDDPARCEIGGTAYDIEALPFFEAIRQLNNDLLRGRSIFVHLTPLPYISAAGEMKTKPTQHSVKELRSIGIQPDILLCRCDRPYRRARK